MTVSLEEVKNYLDITWETAPEEDKKLKGMIERAEAALIGKIGACDFEEDTQEKTLLFNHVMYERAGALADFWQHYRGEIISLRLRNKVRAYGEEQTASDIQ